MNTQEENTDEKPKLVKCSFEFSQEPNCNDSENDIEIIEIEFNSSLGIDNDGDGYFVLKTTSWSVDGENQIKELFDRIRKMKQ